LTQKHIHGTSLRPLCILSGQPIVVIIIVNITALCKVGMPCGHQWKFFTLVHYTHLSYVVFTMWRLFDCSRVGWTLHRKYLYYSYSLQLYTRIWLDGVQCTGSETNIANCRHKGWGVSDCNHNDDVSIACHDNMTTVTSGEW